MIFALNPVAFRNECSNKIHVYVWHAQHNLQQIKMISESSAENVRQLGTEELCRFLQTYFDQDEWKDVDRVIREQKIKGNSFLDITKAEWLSVGLTLGVATSLIQISHLQRSASVGWANNSGRAQSCKSY